MSKGLDGNLKGNAIAAFEITPNGKETGKIYFPTEHR